MKTHGRKKPRKNKMSHLINIIQQGKLIRMIQMPELESLYITPRTFSMHLHNNRTHSLETCLVFLGLGQQNYLLYVCIGADQIAIKLLSNWSVRQLWCQCWCIEILLYIIYLVCFLLYYTLSAGNSSCLHCIKIQIYTVTYVCL